MGRGVDVIRRREWDERLRRYANSRLTLGHLCVGGPVGRCVLRFAKKLAGGQPRRCVTGKLLLPSYANSH